MPLGGYFIYCHRSWAAFIKVLYPIAVLLTGLPLGGIVQQCSRSFELRYVTVLKFFTGGISVNEALGLLCSPDYAKDHNSSRCVSPTTLQMSFQIIAFKGELWSFLNRQLHCSSNYCWNPSCAHWLKQIIQQNFCAVKTTWGFKKKKVVMPYNYLSKEIVRLL